jgi:hypothetical protein
MTSLVIEQKFVKTGKSFEDNQVIGKKNKSNKSIILFPPKVIKLSYTFKTVSRTGE